MKSSKRENKDYQKFEAWVKDTYPDEWDKIDAYAIFDTNLTLSENMTELLSQHPIFNPEEALKEAQEREKHDKIGQNKMIKDSEELQAVLKSCKNLFITADSGEGKTSLAHYIAELYKTHPLSYPVYFYSHPKPKEIRKLGFENLFSIDAVEKMSRAVIILDEPTITLPRYDKRGSIKLLKALSIARHKDIKFIIITSDTRYITISEEFYIDTYLIKRIDYKHIKRGSMIKRIIEEMAIISPEGYADEIEIGEFVFWNRKTPMLNGKHKFSLVNYWNEGLSKIYS